jgi:two-component system LytT family response regulator
MERIRALIVDDEPIARRGVRRFLRTEPDIEVIGECADGRDAIITIERQKPDLVFLDVQMPLMNGFEVVQRIDSSNLPAVVFITAYDEHAIRAFEVNALDYLLKPLDPERFQKTLMRVREHAGRSNAEQLNHKIFSLLRTLDELKETTPRSERLERIAIKDNDRISFLSTDDIVWLSSQGNYVEIHAARETHRLRETVDRMEQSLDPRKFVRLRRSTIVRTDQIKELHSLFNGEYAVILKDGTKLQSSRRYRKNLKVLLKP